MQNIADRFKLVAVVGIILSIMFVGGVQAQSLVFEEAFDEPDLYGWEHSPGVEISGGMLRVEPDNFAFFTSNWGDSRLVAQIRLIGEGEAVIGYRAADWNSFKVIIGPDFIIAQRELGQDIAEEIDGVSGIPIPHGEWFQFELVMVAGLEQIFINEQLVLEIQDSDPYPEGGILFHTMGLITMEVDHFAVYDPGGSPKDKEPPPEESAPPPEETELPAENGGEITFEGDLAWVRTGGPLGGLGYDVRMHPENPDIMFVTDAFAGVFKSVDGGKTWFPTNQGIDVRSGLSADAIPIFCLTIDPNNPEIIWAGTEFQRGIYKSTDGGETWTKKISGIIEKVGITFRGITVDPNNSQIVYAGAEIGSVTWAGEEQWGREFDKTKGVVYKSTNGGESWQAIWRGENMVRYIIVDPRDPNVLYVSTGLFDREAANSDWESEIPGGEGILKSTDGGQTWNQINNGLNNLYIGSLMIHPENPDILLAGAANNTFREGGGVYLTTNGGETWTQVLDSEAQSVEFSTSNPMVAYAGNPGEIYRSTDGGKTWNMVLEREGSWGPPGVEAGFPIDFQIDPFNSDRIFANNYGGGNFLSEDGGRTWISSSAGYTGAQTRWLAVSPTEPGVVYAGARSGIFVSTDGGGKWDGLIYPDSNGLEWVALAVDPENPKHVLASNKYERLTYQSKNGGLSWKVVDVPLLGWYSPRVIAFAPSDSQVVYLGYGSHEGGGSNETYGAAGGLYVSHNGGANWSSANDAQTEEAHVTDIAIHPSNPQGVYMASPNDGLFKSEDGGTSWTNLTSSFQWWFRPSAVAINPENPDLILMGSEGNGLYRSVDAGQTWTQISAGIPPESRIPTVIFHPTDPSVAFCGDLLSGVYLSQDHGVTWQAISTGLRTRAVNKLVISSDGWQLYAATEGEGVFRLDLNGQPPEAGTPLITETDSSSNPADQPEEEPQSPPPADEPRPEDQPDEDEGEFQPPSLSTMLLIAGGLILLAAVILIVIFKIRGS